MEEPQATAPPNLKGPPATRRWSLRVAEMVLTALLTAHKGGGLADLLARRPRLARWVRLHYLGPVLGTAGDALTAPHAEAQALVLLLRWAVAQLRPDGARHLGDIDRKAWLDSTSWRPMLALACHFGFLAVPEFNERYRRRPDESAADNLCGLWNVGPSTFYRYLEKGKRLLAEDLAHKQLTGSRCVSLREGVEQEVMRQRAWGSTDERTAWHQTQATAAAARCDCRSALWHLSRAGDHAGFIRTLRRFRIELAQEEETDALIEGFVRLAEDRSAQFELHLACATLWNVRNAEARALEVFEQARALAAQADSPWMLARVYGWLGTFYEPRDRDRALACLEDAAEFMRQAALDPEHGALPEVSEEYVGALRRLAWHYVQRNDARARAVLERADVLRGTLRVSPEANALAEQVWGEYWRRTGELRRAAEHQHRALNIFERLGDMRQVLATYNNLSLIYSEARDFDRAIDYGGRVVASAAKTSVEPYLMTSVLLNMGVAYFWQERYDHAIEHYRRGLQHALAADLKVHANRAQYNLAEAYYKRFQQSRDPEDERQGDRYAAAALKAAPSESDPGHLEATRALKADILGPHEGFVHDRLMPEEVAAHFHEMAVVRQQRTVLALPAPAEVHVRARLAIAKAYLMMSTKERDAAMSLIDKHRLGDAFACDLDDLRATFDRELTREQQLLQRWKQSIGDLLTDDRRAVLLDRLVRGEPITKSTYAELCSVGLATASKHLGLLTERGLVVQVGKGPKTRYLLAP